VSVFSTIHKLNVPPKLDSIVVGICVDLLEIFRKQSSYARLFRELSMANSDTKAKLANTQNTSFDKINSDVNNEWKWIIDALLSFPTRVANCLRRATPRNLAEPRFSRCLVKNALSLIDFDNYINQNQLFSFIGEKMVCF
jgi:hypothetical protein